MPVRILIVASTDLTPELGDTVLWRDSIERVFSPTASAAREVIPGLGPRLIVVDAADSEAAVRFVEGLRAEPLTRSISVAAVSRDPNLADEPALMDAGANLVLAGHVDGALWDGRIEQLLEVPKRRDVRVPVLCEVWSQFGSGAEPPLEGWALNLSVSGALLETEQMLDLGSKLDLALTLPGVASQVRVVAQAVREAGEQSGRFRTGVEFLILREDARERLEAFVASGMGD